VCIAALVMRLPMIQPPAPFAAADHLQSRPVAGNTSFQRVITKLGIFSRLLDLLEQLARASPCGGRSLQSKDPPDAEVVKNAPVVHLRQPSRPH